MKYKHIILPLAVSILIVASCTKPFTNNNENTNREQPAQPEGFTIDTTWGEGTNVPF